MPRMGKTEEHWNGLKLGFLKTVQPNSFSMLIPAACKNNAQETYLFDTDLWFCHLYVIFFAYFKFHSDWGRVIGKIKQNELNCRDTAPFNPTREDEWSLRRLSPSTFGRGRGQNQQKNTDMFYYFQSQVYNN